jgi:guanyl-specific ribonuclease Sa
MAGISDKALKTNYAENKYRYNSGNELQNKEFSDGSGLELYDAIHRMYDPQLGRFGQIDAHAHLFENWSPYSFAIDYPDLLNDPSGLQISDSAHPQNLAPATVTPHTTTIPASAIQFTDLWPLRKNLNYFLGGNQPADVHYTIGTHWDWQKLQQIKPMVKVVAVGLSLIPAAKGIRMAYGLLKLAQGLEEAEIPETAENVADNALNKNGAALPGWKGGPAFGNSEGTPRVPGQNRGTERIVVGSDGSAYYTNDHYQSFTQIRGN